MSSTRMPVSAIRRFVSRISTGSSIRGYPGEVGVTAMSLRPTASKPVRAATLMSSGGGSVTAVRCARERIRSIVFTPLQSEQRRGHVVRRNSLGSPRGSRIGPMRAHRFPAQWHRRHGGQGRCSRRSSPGRDSGATQGLGLLAGSRVHIHPPDQAVVSPSTGSFSGTITFRPCHAAVTAAERPPAPEPTTSKSQSRCRPSPVSVGMTTPFYRGGGCKGRFGGCEIGNVDDLLQQRFEGLAACIEIVSSYPRAWYPTRASCLSSRAAAWRRSDPGARPCYGSPGLLRRKRSSQ